MKKYALIAIIAFVSINLSGCAHPGRIASAQLTGVKLGMTEAEVIQILGKPQTVSMDSNATIYRYYSKQGQYIIIYQNLTFTKGKLTSLLSEKPQVGGIIGAP